MAIIFIPEFAPKFIKSVKIITVIMVLFFITFVGGCVYFVLKESVIDSVNIDKATRTVIKLYEEEKYWDIYRKLDDRVITQTPQSEFIGELIHRKQTLGTIQIKDSTELHYGEEHGLKFIYRGYNLRTSDGAAALLVFLSQDNPDKILRIEFRH